MWVDMFRQQGMAEFINPSVRDDEDVFEIIRNVKSCQQRHIDRYLKKSYKPSVPKRCGLHCRPKRRLLKEFKGVISDEEVFWLSVDSAKRKRRKGVGWSKGSLEYFSRQSLQWFPVVDLRIREARQRTDVDFVMGWGIAVRDHTEKVLRERFNIPEWQRPSWDAEFTNTGRVKGICEADWE